MTTSQLPALFGVVPAATAMQTDGLTFLRNMISQHYPSPPFAETSDIWLVVAEHGRVLFEALPATRFLNPLGTIHGGWTSTLLDSAMGCAVHSSRSPRCRQAPR
jgi:acyl-coenzyme A thioesterase PaaI-like protein